MENKCEMGIDDWKQLALWLLDCEAATADYYLHLKSGSKHEKQRHLSICQEAVQDIKSGWFGRRERDCSAVIERVERLFAAKQ